MSLCFLKHSNEQLWIEIVIHAFPRCWTDFHVTCQYWMQRGHLYFLDSTGHSKHFIFDLYKQFLKNLHCSSMRKTKTMCHSNVKSAHYVRICRAPTGNLFETQQNYQHIEAHQKCFLLLTTKCCKLNAAIKMKIQAIILRRISHHGIVILIQTYRLRFLV